MKDADQIRTLKDLASAMPRISMEGSEKLSRVPAKMVFPVWVACALAHLDDTLPGMNSAALFQDPHCSTSPAVWVAKQLVTGRGTYRLYCFHSWYHLLRGLKGIMWFVCSFILVLGIKRRALSMLGKRSTTETSLLPLEKSFILPSTYKQRDLVRILYAYFGRQSGRTIKIFLFIFLKIQKRPKG